MKYLSWALVALLFTVGLTAAQDASGTPEAICEAASTEEPETREFAGAEDVLQAGVDYQAIFCTEAGPVYVDLFENYAPETVNNFVFLAENDYYNNTTFHRVLQDFMAQGGDPTGTGAGGPGYQFRDEFLIFMTFDRPGLLAMANGNRPDQGITGTNGSQFFLTTSVPDYLNYRHTIFGEVLSGQANVENLQLRDPQQQPDFEGDALNTVVIITDPAAVEGVEAEPQTPRDAATISETMDEVTGILPPDLVMSEDNTGTLETTQVVDSAPEAVQDEYADFLDEYGHQYRVQRSIDNATCSQEFFFANLSYTVDAFSDEDASRAALNDGFLTTLKEAQGFSGGELSEIWRVPVFTQEGTYCDDTPATVVQAVFWRGPYLVTVGTIVVPDVLEQAPADVILDEGVARVFDQYLADAFRPLPE